MIEKERGCRTKGSEMVLNPCLEEGKGKLLSIGGPLVFICSEVCKCLCANGFVYERGRENWEHLWERRIELKKEVRRAEKDSEKIVRMFLGCKHELNHENKNKDQIWPTNN